jgi:hypothetical protein
MHFARKLTERLCRDFGRGVPINGDHKLAAPEQGFQYIESEKAGATGN